MNSAGSLPQFSVEGYTSWSFRVESHLASLHDRMWEVITDGPIKVMKRITNRDHEGPDAFVEKPRHKFTDADFKVDNLDRIARNVIQSTVSDAHLPRIVKCKSAKEMWETLALLSHGTKKIKENKQTVLMREFEALKMKKSESMEAFETRVLNIISTLAALGKDLSVEEINTKVCHGLSGRWHIIKENCLFNMDLGAQSTEDLFSDFKAMEFHIGKTELKEAVDPFEKGSAFKAADGVEADFPDNLSHNDIANMSKKELEDFALVLARNINSTNARAETYKHFYKKQQDRSQGFGRAESSTRRQAGVKYTVRCYECQKVGHYKSDCPSLSAKEREDLKARLKTRRAFLTGKSSMPSDDINHDEDQFTDDEDENE